MEKNRSNYRHLFFPIANVVFFVVVCALMRRLGGYDLRVLVESTAAAYLILLTAWAWLGRSDRSRRVLYALLGMVGVFVGCRLSLGSEFPRWIEGAIWYVPIASVFTGALFLAGARIERSENKVRRKSTFSIRALFALTAVVAALFPLIQGLAWARNSPQFYPYAWFLDANALAIPVSVIGVGMLVAVLSGRLWLATMILVVAPIIGILVGRIYGWSQPDTLVRLTVTVAIISGLIGIDRKLNGFSLRRLAFQEPEPIQ